MKLIKLLSAKLDQLELERTGSPSRTLRYGGLWLGLPVLFFFAGVCIKWSYIRQRLDRAGAGVLLLVFVLVTTALVFGCSFYQERVPIKIQLLIDLIAWSVLAWAYFQFRFWAL